MMIDFNLATAGFCLSAIVIWSSVIFVDEAQLRTPRAYACAIMFVAGIFLALVFALFMFGEVIGYVD